MTQFKEVPFKVQIKFLLKGKPVGEIRHLRENVKLTNRASNEHFQLDDVLTVRAVCNRNGNDRVKSIHNYKQVNGAVVYSDINHLPDVEKMVKALAKHKALAVFVTCRPLEPVDIPVFVVKEDLMRDIYQTKENFKIVRTSFSSKSDRHEHLFSSAESRALTSPTRKRCNDSVKIEFHISLSGSSLKGESWRKEMVKTSLLPHGKDTNEHFCEQIMLQPAVWDGNTFTNKSRLKKGSVLYFRGQDMNAIHSISRESADIDALALFVAVRPEESFDIPVFLLDETEFREILQYPAVSVDIIPIIKDGPIEEETNCVEEKNRVESRGFVPFEDISTDHTETGMPYVAAATQDTGTTKSNNFLSQTRSYVTSWIYTLKVKSPLQDILWQNCNWSAEEDLTSFVAAVDLITIAQTSGHHSYSEMKEIYNQIIHHLEQHSNKVDIVLFAFIVHFLYCCDNQKHKDVLRWKAVNCVNKLEISSIVERLCQVSRESNFPTCHPCERISWFVHDILSWMRSNRKMIRLDHVFLSNIVWILDYHCEKKLDWKLLSPLILPGEFPRSANCTLSGLIDEVSFRSLSLSVQNSVEDFCKVLGHFYTNSQADDVVFPIQVDSSLGNKVLELLRSDQLIPNSWRKFIEALDQFRFEQEEYDWKKSVTVLVVERWGARNFTILQHILDAVGVEHSYRKVFNQEVTRSLINLVRSYPPTRDLRAAIQPSSIGDLLGCRTTFDSVQAYVRNKIAKNFGFDVKVGLVEDIYANHMRVQDVNPVDASFLVLDSMKKMLNSKQAWVKFIEIASMKEDLFYAFPDEDSTIESIAMLVIDKGSIAQNTNILQKLPLSDSGRVMSHLVTQILHTLCNFYVDITKAAEFYEKMNPADGPMKRIIDEVLLNAIGMWDTNTLENITLLDLSTLKTINSFPSGVIEAHDTAAKCSTNMVETCSTWNRQFQHQGLSFIEIETILSQHSGEKWDAIKGIVGVKLIDIEKLDESLRKSNDSMESIQLNSHLKVIEKEQVEGNHILEILEKYGCDVKGKGICSVLLRWKGFDSMQLNSIINSYPLADIRNDNEALVSFREKYCSELEIAQYMGSLDCRLFYKEIGFGDWSTITIEKFLDKVSDAKQELLDLLKCSRDHPFAAVKQALDSLVEEDRDLKTDVDMIVSCPYLSVSSDEMSNFRLFASVVSISAPLQNFVGCCKQLNFAFVHSDGSFKKLMEISTCLDLDGKNSFGVEQSHELISQLIDCLSPELDLELIESFLENIVPFFTGISYLSASSDVWTLVREMKWFGKHGLQQFYEEFSNVTNKFLFSDTETYESNILDALEPVVRMVSYIGAQTDETSSNKFYNLTKDVIELQANSLKVTQRNLQLVQENVTNIREWFDSGVDDMTAIFSRFDKVWKTGQFSMVESELCLEYSATDKEEHISASDLNQFIQQLGFVQQENQDISAHITSLIDEYQVLLEVVAKKAQAISIGYSGDKVDTFVFSVSQGLSSARGLLDEAKQMLLECDSWLEKMHSTAPLSLLFWTEDLRNVYDAIVHLPSSNDCDILNTLLPGLSILIPPKILSSIHNDMLSATRQCSDQLGNTSSSSHVDWLKIVSDFLEALHLQLSEPRKITNNNKGGIFLHSFECNEDKKSLISLCVMQHIYKHRAPESFEVLDGMIACTPQKLNIFLGRVIAFPMFTFVILNIQDLCGELQEILVEFISRPQIARKDCNLNCVQRSDTILHSSSWVEQMVWNEKKLQQADLHTLQPYIVDGTFIERVTVIMGASGSGKTRMIRDQMTQLSCKRISLPIHEGTTIHSLAETLRKVQSYESCRIAVHFSFMISLTKDCDARWLNCMNNFFNSLLLTRTVHDPTSGETFFIGWQKWSIFVELQGFDVDCVGHISPSTVEGALVSSIPILFYSSTFVAPTKNYVVDEKALRVSTYLRAYKDGTIDRKFAGSKQVMFVIDISYSMDGFKINTAVDNALTIFDSHVHNGDVFGTMLFHDNVIVRIPLQKVNDDNKHHLRVTLDACRILDGGTSMYSALDTALVHLQRSGHAYDSWIICLTDGESDNKLRDKFRNALCASPSNLHLMVIGVNLKTQYQDYLQNMCAKFSTTVTQGVFVSSEANSEAMNNAFRTVAARIPVSQTFEFDGTLSDQDCWNLIDEYLPDFVTDHDMMRKKFWIEFLYRRVKVFDDNEHFNYNETHDNLGSSLMSIMLYEASQLLSTEHNRDWKESNHEQLIYDFTKPDSPEFRLMCTSPDCMTDESIKRYKSLDLPGFFIPTSEQLRNRRILDCFLSQALNIPLTKDNKGQKRLSCVDDNKFVLTLDFTMKLLNMHERIACHVPCIIEGETGVSKTALTLMYSILVNSSLVEQTRRETLHALTCIREKLTEQGLLHSDDMTAYEIMRTAVIDATDGTMTRRTEIGSQLHQLLFDSIRQRSSIFQDPPDVIKDCSSEETNSILDALKWFSDSLLKMTFFELNIDASLNEGEIQKFFENVCEMARNIAPSGAKVVVFLDEINTSSVMGLFKEIVIDRSFCGKPLESNIAVVAACNPAGRQSLSAESSRESDLGKQWASGHYQVNELPDSMKYLKWNYGALNPEQEKEFVLRRIEMLDEEIPIYLAAELTELVAMSQEAIRSFAAVDIQKGLQRISCCDSIEKEAVTRARSTVSLRDIQRVFTLFKFFVSVFPLTSGKEREQYRVSMLLTVAVVYYFKLDSVNRLHFLNKLRKGTTRPDFIFEFQSLLDEKMTTVIEETQIPDGIAVTTGLKENIFMTLVCSLSCTPLVIIGPPGSSKTLSVNILDDNTNGEESPSQFYRQLSRLSTYHYQCSRTSTSKEVASVFDKAIQRQQKVDPKKHRCLVFMDEAGLPEESKESLKVLHYYLEGHMSANATVGFVAITNHVLDAAKSNRCVSLLRQEPGQEELAQVAEGVLYSASSEQGSIRLVKWEESMIQKENFADLLCLAYKRVLELVLEINEGEFNTFYGLRDFIYFLRSLQHTSRVIDMVMVISRKVIIHALERNFNGIPSIDLKVIIVAFLQQCNINEDISGLIQRPIDVIKSALSNANMHTSSTRYTLIIDESDDDSIMRLLQSEGLISTSQKNLFKLSNMPENTEMEQLSLVSRVKFAAQQGSNTIVLSQTDKINESFYDLFNQHFRRVPSRDGSGDRLYANIAVGGISRRSLVSNTFRCVMHVRGTDLPSLPAPFLNRFEKFRLSIVELLSCKLESSPFLYRTVTRSKTQINSFCSMMCLSGFVSGQTVETIFLNLLRNATVLKLDSETLKTSDFTGTTFITYFTTFVHNCIGLSVSQKECSQLINYGKQFLPLSLSHALDELVTKDKLANPYNVVHAFQECLSGQPHTIVAVLTDCLFEMLLTRKVLTTLLEIASPEEIFKKRFCLPVDLVNEYFHQEHFSLKPFLHSIRNRIKQLKYVIHTRSNGQVMGIPTIRSGSSTSQKLDIVEKFVHSNPHCVMIEHLNSLKNESSLRSTIDTWRNDDSVEILLIIADMSDQVSIERINYVRCCVDQGDLQETKTFVVILHYPTSAFLVNKFYPALFLGGWSHVYLDSIGDEGLSGDMKILVEKTCRVGSYKPFDIGEMANKIMTGAIKSAASHGIIYPEQLLPNQPNSTTAFHANHECLMSLLSVDIIKETSVKNIRSVRDFLSSQFISLWSDENLATILSQAAWSLQNGTSRLGLTSCLKGIMQDAMRKLLLNFLSELNEWMNLDFLSQSCRNEETNSLFHMILLSLPTIPFEELLLHQSDSFHKRKQLPNVEGLTVQFPFFSFISTLLDKVVESTLQKVPAKGEESMILSYPTADLLNNAIDLISAETDGNTIGHEILLYVANSDTLYERYLEQFLHWKLFCLPGSTIALWFRDKLYAESIQAHEELSSRNLLMIHIAARKYDMELARLSSFRNELPLWAKENSDMNALDKSHLAYTFDSARPLDAATEWFSKNLADLLEGDKTSKWVNRFSGFKRTMGDIVGDIAIIDTRMSHTLRLLFFFSILKANLVSQMSMEACIKNVYNLSTSTFQVELKTNMEYLIKIVNKLDESQECKASCTSDLLYHFFSPQWLTSIEMSWKEDLTFMITHLTNTDTLECNTNLLFKLVRNACIYGVALDMKLNKNGRNLHDRVLDLSTSRLMVVDSLLCCNNLSTFSKDGLREKIPHFIPNFARSKHSYSIESPEVSPMKDIGVFFSKYENSFLGAEMLAEVVFQIVVQRLISLSDGQSSDKLLLPLLEDIESECKLTHQDQTRLCQKRSTFKPSDGPSANIHTGSTMSVMITESRIICFLLRIAFEMASDLPVSALEGIYSDLGRPMLQNIMSIPNTRWQEIFMLNIVKIAGEGKLMSLLSDNHSILGNLNWANEWKGGLPTMKNGIEEKLCTAEQELREAEDEEKKKSQEMRLCPNCQQPFLVLQQNCGQFVCGHHDTHTTSTNCTHGCGHGFQLSMTHYYNVDENILVPLRNAVTNERQYLQQHNIMSRVWEWMQEAELPYLSSAIASNQNHFTPQSITMTTIGKESNVFRHLAESRETVMSFQMLPQLIELYMWLHSTFNSIISQEQASTILVGDLMKSEHLSKRFDAINVQHLILLWEETKNSLNTHLDNCGHSVNWDCETVSIPFKRIEEATLIMLLSVYKHPTGGCDYLFIIINQIIGQFNDFMRKLCKSEVAGADADSIEPKDLLFRSPAALSLQLLKFISSAGFPILVENFRLPYKDKYDVIALETAIMNELAGCQFDIKNPLSNLRTQFQFRKDMSIQDIGGVGMPGLQSSVGTYFVHRQDLQLFENCQELLNKQEVQPLDHNLNHTFMAKFQNLDYEKLRGILEGARNTLNTFTFSTNQNFSVCLSAGHTLEDMGFPKLSESQVQLILALTANQVAEFIQYIGYQLASEAYHFSMLPLSMNSDISNITRFTLQKNIEELIKEKGKEFVFNCLGEFSTDILNFYQNEIRDHCKSSNDSMKVFLEVNHFCDNSDSIFVALPEKITVRNYIRLQQELHQLILQVMLKEGIIEPYEDQLNIELHPEFAKPRRGKSWILHPDKSNDEEDEDEIVYSTEDNSSINELVETGDLWFESSIRNTIPLSGTRDNTSENISFSGDEEKEDDVTYYGEDYLSTNKVVCNDDLSFDSSIRNVMPISDTRDDNSNDISLSHSNLSDKDAQGKASPHDTYVYNDQKLDSRNGKLDTLNNIEAIAAIKIQDWWKSMNNKTVNQTAFNEMEEVQNFSSLETFRPEQNKICKSYWTLTNAMGFAVLSIFFLGGLVYLSIFNYNFVVKMPGQTVLLFLIFLATTFYLSSHLIYHQ